MLWKDLPEDACDLCPLYKAGICNASFNCYGGEPIEPPCCNFNDNTDLDKYVCDYFEKRKNRLKREEALLKAKKDKSERAKKAAETRKEMQWYCRSELKALKDLQKMYKKYKSMSDYMITYANAVNFANSVQGIGDRVVVEADISRNMAILEEKIKQAQDAYDAKRKEFYSEKKGQNK